MKQYTAERARLNLIPASASSALSSPSLPKAQSPASPGSSPATPTRVLPSNRSDTASSWTRYSDSTLVELEMEEGEEEGGKLSMLLEFGEDTNGSLARYAFFFQKSFLGMVVTDGMLDGGKFRVSSGFATKCCVPIV